jgi:hypothetical protein
MPNTQPNRKKETNIADFTSFVKKTIIHNIKPSKYPGRLTSSAPIPLFPTSVFLEL